MGAMSSGEQGIVKNKGWWRTMDGGEQRWWRAINGGGPEVVESSMSWSVGFSGVEKIRSWRAGDNRE